MTFDLGNHTTAVPVGFGAGKVWSFGNGNTVNAFVEPQYSVVHSRIGVPVWQIFAESTSNSRCNSWVCAHNPDYRDRRPP